MKTGSHLKIKSFGDNAIGVHLEGNPNKPEPIYFIVKLPFGEVEITRTDDNDYWVHVGIVTEEQKIAEENLRVGKFVAARIDLTSQHTALVDTGDFGHPDMYHMAVRIAPKD